MKISTLIAGTVLAVTLAAALFSARADGTNSTAAANRKPVPYPLDTCIISGDKLGGMSEPVVFLYQTNGINQEIKFCCPMCKSEFLKSPDKYMKIIQQAETKSKSDNK